MREQIQDAPSRHRAGKNRTQGGIGLPTSVVTRGASYWKLVLGILLVGILVLFVTQNANAIPVSFLVWEIEISQALVIFLTLLSGVLIGVMVSKWHRWRLSHSPRDTENR